MPWLPFPVRAASAHLALPAHSLVLPGRVPHRSPLPAWVAWPPPSRRPPLRLSRPRQDGNKGLASGRDACLRSVVWAIHGRYVRRPLKGAPIVPSGLSTHAVIPSTGRPGFCCALFRLECSSAYPRCLPGQCAVARVPLLRNGLACTWQRVSGALRPGTRPSSVGVLPRLCRPSLRKALPPRLSRDLRYPWPWPPRILLSFLCLFSPVFRTPRSSPPVPAVAYFALSRSPPPASLPCLRALLTPPFPVLLLRAPALPACAPGPAVCPTRFCVGCRFVLVLVFSPGFQSFVSAVSMSWPFPSFPLRSLPAFPPLPAYLALGQVGGFHCLLHSTFFLTFSPFPLSVLSFRCRWLLCAVCCRAQ